jgi:hypothetical protein
MLQAMQPSGQAIPSPSSQSFAGLLASLASPEPDRPGHTPESSVGDLGEDVVTLSYERALRNHARYKPANPGDWHMPVATGRAPLNAQQMQSQFDSIGAEDASADMSATPKSANDRKLRSTSVTIRLSSAESARLHQRAAEAGVTVSAYLRSCTFEADALRAQVKAALAQLRAAAPDEKRAEPAAPARHSWFQWLMQRLKRGSAMERAAQL